MKKLIVAGTLVVALAFPLASKAEVSAFGVNIPVGQSEVSDNIRGGSIAEYPFYPINAQKLGDHTGSAPSDETEYENVYSVFGVRVSGSDVI